MQSVPIATDVVGSTPAQGEVYNIVIKFVSDLRQVGGFLLLVCQTPLFDNFSNAFLMMTYISRLRNFKMVFLNNIRGTSQYSLHFM
jgi:hypothetical protein